MRVQSLTLSVPEEEITCTENLPHLFQDSINFTHFK